MLRIDFEQRFRDHRSILIFVKKLGALAEPEFSQLFEDMSQLRTVELPNGRIIHLRYTRHISHQFIEWGNFHMHKKLMGILSIAKMVDEDIGAIKKAHESLKTWYENTALESRCFILGCDNSSGDAKPDREFVFLRKDNFMKEIAKQVADYALSLFLVLESKRKDTSLEKPDKFSFLRSPLDVELLVDNDSRNKKQNIGRMKKYFGDLCLVTGVAEEAIYYYSFAIDILRSVGDLLWMAGALEGLCAASLLCRNKHKIVSPERASLQLDISQLSTTGPVNGGRTDGEDSKITSLIPLIDAEIIDKSEEIIEVYEKHKKSRVLSVEAKFKYARFHLSRKNYKSVSNTLQGIMMTEMILKLSDTEKIQMYSAMSMMYEDIGYIRKAAFFTRKAARHCTSQHLPPQGWMASYNLMRNALEGYKIQFSNKSPDTERECEQGWPLLKIQLMKELIEMSKGLQNPNIPIRHISYLLQSMHQYIDENDLQDLITSLEKLASTPDEQHSLVDDLVLSNNDLLPPVALTHLPIVRDFKVNGLPSHLRPILSPSSPSPVKTPFIYTTIKKASRRTKKNNPVIRWVEGEVSEVSMQVNNPLPFDIKISKMTLLTDGVPFEAYPSCLALSNDNMPHPFMLLGVPKGSGQLAITGYSVELFGIRSNCPISETILDKQYTIPLIVNVTPKLPLVQFQNRISGVQSFLNSSHKGSSLVLEVQLYTGQCINGQILVENTSKVPVEQFTVTLLNGINKGRMNLVTLDQDEISQCLPLEPGATTFFNLTFSGQLLDSLQDGDTLNWSGKLKILYSGGEAGVLGMSRQAAVDIKVEVLPSLISTSYLALHVGNGERFELKMNVCNKTKCKIEWRFEMSSGIKYPKELMKLDAGASVRTSLELDTIHVPCDKSKREDRDVCTEKILDLVKLRWEIPEQKITGLVQLEHFKVTEEMVNIIRKHHLAFEMFMDGKKLKEGDDVNCPSTKPVFFTIKIHNSSEKDVVSSILNVEPFELVDKDWKIFDVKHKICWLGATSTFLPTIKSHSSVEHGFGLLFLTTGRFCINLKCFERSSSGAQQFRSRTQVIKRQSSSEGRPRSSRSGSFTDSLLLKQRTQSTPLAQISFSCQFNVSDDPTLTINTSISVPLKSPTMSKISTRVPATVHETSVMDFANASDANDNSGRKTLLSVAESFRSSNESSKLVEMPLRTEICAEKDFESLKWNRDGSHAKYADKTAISDGETFDTFERKVEENKSLTEQRIMNFNVTAKFVDHSHVENGKNYDGELKTTIDGDAGSGKVVDGVEVGETQTKTVLQKRVDVSFMRNPEESHVRRNEKHNDDCEKELRTSGMELEQIEEGDTRDPSVVQSISIENTNINSVEEQNTVVNTECKNSLEDDESNEDVGKSPSVRDRINFFTSN